MWKFLYQLSSPYAFYTYTKSCLSWLGWSSLIIITLALIWGLGFVAPDIQQSDAFRIIYVHVPCAFFSMAIYAAMGFLALLLLVWRIKMAGVMLHACAEVGACMAVLALITGSIWGKPMWGTWWIWDARLTSELILLFLYAAILAMRHAYQHTERADKMIAILVLVGLLDLPIIHYSVYWWNTLHQGATLSFLGKSSIDSSMLYPLLLSFVGFACYVLYVVLSKAQIELITRERHKHWVLTIVEAQK